MPRTDHTAILFILDRSGSMQSIREDVVGGFASFVERQRAEQGTASLTLVQFDDRYEVVYVDRPLPGVPLPLRHEPRGTTALLDAVARGVGQLADALAQKPEADRPASVTVVVVTDGHENASTEVTKEQVRALVARKRAEGWKFLYFGADVDHFAEAERVGIDHAAGFRRSPAGARAAFDGMSDAVSSVRKGDLRSLDALARRTPAGDEERERRGST